MTESMIERIVEVLEKLPIRDNAERGGELDKLRLREAARAAILAMREPTEAMYCSGGDYLVPMSSLRQSAPGWELKKPATQHFWNKMIDAALIWPPGSADIAGVPMARD